MKVNKQVDLGIKIVGVLRNSFAPVSASSLAVQVGSTPFFVDQIVRKMRIAGITDAHRGHGGGHSIKKDSRVTALDVAKAVGHDPESFSLSDGPSLALKQGIAKAFSEIVL